MSRRRRPSRFLGIGRETSPTAAATAAPARFWPVLGPDDEQCEVCAAVKPREDLVHVSFDESGSLYACRHHRTGG